MALMFDKEAVEIASHPLVRLLRLIFYRMKITSDDYVALWAKHGQRLGWSPQNANIMRNNSRSPLSDGRVITYRLFSYIIFNILQLEVVEFQIKLREIETGKTFVVSDSDPVE